MMRFPQSLTIALVSVLAIALMFALLFLAQQRTHAGTVTSAEGQRQSAQTAPQQFYGVALGRPQASVRAQLGEPSLVVTTNHGPTWAYSIQHETAWLVVLFQQGLVASINVLPQDEHTAKLIDPFGIHVGDTLKRLNAVRGRATGFADPNIYYYGHAGQPGWMYGMSGSVISSIGVTTGETNVPALIIDWRRDGTTPDRAILVHVQRGQSIEFRELADLDKAFCGDLGTWQLLEKRHVALLGKGLEAVRAGCGNSALQMTFYFQVSN